MMFSLGSNPALKSSQRDGDGRTVRYAAVCLSADNKSMRVRGLCNVYRLLIHQKARPDS